MSNQKRSTRTMTRKAMTKRYRRASSMAKGLRRWGIDPLEYGVDPSKYKLKGLGAAGTARRAKRAGCKKGYYKSRSGALKGRCLKRAQHTVVRGKGRKVLRGAARLAQMCKGNKGSAYKACIAHALDGVFMPSFSRGGRSRRR